MKKYHLLFKRQSHAIPLAASLPPPPPTSWWIAPCLLARSIIHLKSNHHHIRLFHPIVHWSSSSPVIRQILLSIKINHSGQNEKQACAYFIDKKLECLRSFSRQGVWWVRADLFLWWCMLYTSKLQMTVAFWLQISLLHYLSIYTYQSHIERLEKEASQNHTINSLLRKGIP